MKLFSIFFNNHVGNCACGVCLIAVKSEGTLNCFKSGSFEPAVQLTWACVSIAFFGR